MKDIVDVLSLSERVHYINIQNDSCPDEILNEMVFKLLEENKNVVLRVVNYERS